MDKCWVGLPNRNPSHILMGRGGHKPTTHGFTQTQTKLNGLGWVNYENGLDVGFI